MEEHTDRVTRWAEEDAEQAWQERRAARQAEDDADAERAEERVRAVEP